MMTIVDARPAMASTIVDVLPVMASTIVDAHPQGVKAGS